MPLNRIHKLSLFYSNVQSFWYGKTTEVLYPKLDATLSYSPATASDSAIEQELTSYPCHTPKPPKQPPQTHPSYHLPITSAPFRR